MACFFTAGILRCCSRKSTGVIDNIKNNCIPFRRASSRVLVYAGSLSWLMGRWFISPVLSCYNKAKSLPWKWSMYFTNLFYQKYFNSLMFLWHFFVCCSATISETWHFLQMSPIKSLPGKGRIFPFSCWKAFNLNTETTTTVKVEQLIYLGVEHIQYFCEKVKLRVTMLQWF